VRPPRRRAGNGATGPADSRTSSPSSSSPPRPAPATVPTSTASARTRTCTGTSSGSGSRAGAAAVPDTGGPEPAEEEGRRDLRSRRDAVASRSFPATGGAVVRATAADAERQRPLRIPAIRSRRATTAAAATVAALTAAVAARDRRPRRRRRCACLPGPPPFPTS
jgi:hypothetical protein